MIVDNEIQYRLPFWQTANFMPIRGCKFRAKIALPLAKNRCRKLLVYKELGLRGGRVALSAYVVRVYVNRFMKKKRSPPAGIRHTTDGPGAKRGRNVTRLR